MKVEEMMGFLISGLNYSDIVLLYLQLTRLAIGCARLADLDKEFDKT